MSAQLAPARPPRHVKVTGPRQTFAYERCEDEDCFVTDTGIGSSCGRPACPSCGSGGANLTEVGPRPTGIEVRCTCGNAWIHEPTARVSPALALADHAGR